MDAYDQQVLKALNRWKKRMSRKPSVISRLSSNVQGKLNSYLPEKFHSALTIAIREMVRAVLFGARYTTSVQRKGSLAEREAQVRERISLYRKTAAAEGGITGAGGILLGLADFPLLLGIKMKLLFEIASIYGFDVKDYHERLFILYVFQLAFSSQSHRRNIFRQVEHWQEHVKTLPADISGFEWRRFQQEYRDYIDLAKMLQLVPGIGAAVGLVVNYRLINQLGETAMNAYRLRWQQLCMLQQ
ncbi:MAG TPA: EcsC family protein [Chitinophagaceae bacterium]